MDSILTLKMEILEGWKTYLSLKKRRSPRTVDTYMQMATHLLDTFESLEMDRSQFRKFFRSQCTSVAAATAAQRASALSQFIRWAHHEGYVSLEFLKEIIRPKLSKPLVEIVDEEEIQKLRQALLSKPTEEQILFELLYGLGLRFSEAATLKNTQISLERLEIRIRGKGKKFRALPLLPRLHSLLKIWMPEHPDLLGTWKTSQLRSWVKDWQKEIPGIALRPHKFRHSIATHLLKRGAKLPQIQKFLGHQHLATTERYTHLNPEFILQSYDQSFPKKLKK